VIALNKLAVFDLEIVKTVTGVDDWFDVAPLGISCLAVALSDSPDAIVWYGDNELGIEGSRAVVAGLIQLVNDGYTIAGFNSLGFDFRVLAIESGMFTECKALAFNHIDLFFHLFCLLGYAPGLDRLAEGMDTTRKTKGMDGAKAPEMWRNGQRQAVLDYCVQDTRATLELLLAIADKKQARWTSKSSRPVIVGVDGLLTTGQAMELPQPDTSWMDNAWQRSKFSGWIDEPNS
jgi:hypothetical protein